MSVDLKWIRNPSDEQAVAEGCTFDESAGQYVCDFIETFCRQSKGKWAGQKIRLLDWQRDFIMRLFGWKRPDGTRRFRRAYVEVAKKNGKSTLISALALYLLIADGENGPEIYLNACDRAQARIVFDEADRMVKASPSLSSCLRPIDTRNRIVWDEGNGAIIANSAVAPNKDGLNPNGVVFDELHRQPGYDLWDVFEYASAARLQPLTLAITTAGEDESGVWFEQREYSEKVNRGEIPDTSHLGIVYRADPKDDIDDPATWLKANPSLGETISYDDFAADLAKAKETPRKLAGFKRLRLNIVTAAASSFLAEGAWKSCDSPKPSLEALRGLPLYLGGDLSQTTDLTALVGLWGDEDSGFDLVAWFFIPEGRVAELEQVDKVPYRHWIEAGWIIATPGDVIDYGFIRSTINELAADHDVRKLLLDPYNATKLAIDLRDSDGIEVEFIRQGFLSLSAPTKELERLVKARKIRNGGNPVLAWMMGNAVIVEDSQKNVKLDKKKSRKKIDGPAALVNAVAAASSGEESGDSVYNDREMIVL